MTYSQDSLEVAERIRRIENNLLPDPPVWSQKVEPTTIVERMAYHRTPGVSVAVIHHGELEWARGYGVLEAGKPEPVTPETIFQVCSISKHVAMVGALRLVQDGVLNLDEDVNHYLVSWKVSANGTWQPRVTLRQLLGHTAGLVYNWYRGFRHGDSIPALLQVLKGEPPANTPPVRVVLIPGSQFRYSGSHYSVLQQLMTDVAGKPFPQLMHELVFDPLGMHNSSYDLSYPDSRPESTAVGHYIGGEPVYGKWRVIPEMAAAGLWSTASDLARLACEIQRAHANEPTRFLSKQIMDQALTPQVIETFGLGTHLEGRGTSLRFGHGGDGIGYNCLSIAYVEGGMGAVVLTNADDGNWVIRDLLCAIAQEHAWPDYIPRHASITLDPHIYDTHVGEYQLRPGFSISITKREDALFLEVAGQAPIELQPASETVFFAQAVNSEITFAKSEAGETIGLSLKQEEQALQAKKIR